MSQMPRGQHFALFGNVAMQREYCVHCRQYAFVSDGKLACCSSPTEFESNRTKRMSAAQDVRKRPSPEERRQILEMQENRGLYCLRLFNIPVIRKEKLLWLKVTWDHWIPYSYGQNNYPYNFVAACQICNGIKSNLMFVSIEAARVYIQTLWEAKEIESEDGSGVGRPPVNGG